MYISNNQIYVSIITLGVLGPIMEELIFRKIIYNELKENNSIKKSIIIGAIIFSLFHFNLLQFPYTFILGIILNYTYEKYQSILVPIIIHILSNLTSLFLVYLFNYNFNILNIIIFLILIIYLFNYYIIKNNLCYNIYGEYDVKKNKKC